MPEEPRTPDPVEHLRLFIAAMNRRDFDAMLSFSAPNAVADFSQRGVGTFEGSAALRGFMENYWRSYDFLCMSLMRSALSTRGPAGWSASRPARSRSLVSFDTRNAWVFSFSADGMIVRVWTSSDLDEARAAAERLAQKRG